MKTFALRSPSGEIVKGWGLSKFAREHNLDNTLLGKVVNGEAWQHKGWTNPEKSSEEFLTRLSGPFSLVDPNGEVIEGVNLGKFCKENNLDYRYMAQVVRGHKAQYKGWMAPKTPGQVDIAQ